MSLHGLLASFDRSRFDASVLSLSGHGAIAERISSLGIPVHALGLRSRGISPSRVRRVMRAVSSWNPILVPRVDVSRESWRHGPREIQTSAVAHSLEHSACG